MKKFLQGSSVSLKLRSLDISENKRLKSLPVSISELRSLERLKLSGCSVLQSIPPEICQIMGCLRWLDLDRTSIKELPEKIGNLVALEVLQARKTNARLQALPDDLPRRLLYIYAHGCTSLVSISGCFKHHCLRKLVASNCYKLDQEAQILIHRNIKLDSAKQEHSYFPGENVPSYFSHQAVGSSLRIDLPQSESSSDILGFSTCIMIGVDGQYSMNDLKIRCSCILKGVDANELVVMDEIWYPDPKAFTNMCFGSDHLLLFSRTCMSMGAYNEALFEFSIENAKEDFFQAAWRSEKMCGAPHIV